MAPEKKDDVGLLLKYSGLVISIVTMLVTFGGSYVLVKYRVDQLEQKAANALGVEKVREIVREENKSLTDKFDEYEKRDEQRTSFGERPWRNMRNESMTSK